MLQFNRSGYLVPNNPIRSNISELEKTFVIQYSSVERSTLFEEYLRYSKDLKALCENTELRQWINGSFVTRKNPRPSDIDMITFIDTDIFQKLGDKLHPFAYPNSKENYPGVDAYIVESFKEKNVLFKHDQAYWHQQFDTTRRNKRTGKKLPKGFLEIIY
jgi:hypothetical protein